MRTLLAAGECHDLLGDRQAALKDYQAAIAAGPNTSRADTARKRLEFAISRQLDGVSRVGSEGRLGQTGTGHGAFT